MTVLEYAPQKGEILEFINQSIRQLNEAGGEAKAILLGPSAYTQLRKAMGRTFQRGAGQFETYQFIPIVVDPFRDDEVCVLPAPSDVEKRVNAQRIPRPSSS